jgi:hypothetical protein
MAADWAGSKLYSMLAVQVQLQIPQVKLQVL